MSYRKLIPGTYMKTGEKLFADKTCFICINKKQIASAITSHYYRGISAAGDNLVIVADDEQEK